jgi:MFS family permease
MDVIHQKPVKRWTWADLQSSYRFWGLVFYFTAVVASQSLFTSFSALYIRQTADFPISMIGVAVGLQQVGMLFGALLAWMASRMKSYYLLYLLSGLYLFGLFLFCFHTSSLVLMMTGEVLIGMGLGAIMLIVPAFIAGAVGSVEAFVLSFGLMVTLKMLLSSSLVAVFGWLLDTAQLFSSPVYFFTTLSVPAIFGTLLLLPLKAHLFNCEPSVRQAIPQPVKYRDPAVTFLLFLVPFYNIYWLVKIHGEIRNYTQSAALLTPRGAGWSAFVTAFVTPVIFSTLNDTLRAIIESHGQTARYKTWLIILFAFLLPPVSAALIQSQMNEINGNLKRVEQLP